MNFNFLKTYIFWWAGIFSGFMVLFNELSSPNEGGISMLISASLILSIPLSLIFTFFHKWITEIRLKKLNLGVPVGATNQPSVDNPILKFLKFSGIFFFVSYVLLEIISTMGHSSWVNGFTVSVSLIFIYFYFLIKSLPDVHKKEPLASLITPEDSVIDSAGWHVRGMLVNKKTIKLFVIQNIGTSLFAIIAGVILLNNVGTVTVMLLGMLNLFGLREAAGWSGLVFLFVLLPLDVVALIIYFYAHQRGKIPSLLFNVFSYTLVGVIIVPVVLAILFNLR